MKGLHSILLLTVLAGAIMAGCESLSGPSPNEAPNTTLANVPAENDTIFSLVTLHWDGGDPDGYVDTYEYRAKTYHLFEGDSVIKDWVTVTETSKSIAFNSSDEMNRQVFEVRAVDNEGKADPTPARRVFYTPKSNPPSITIHQPGQDTTQYIAEQTTDWFEGIRIRFSAHVDQGRIEEYAYSVDDGPLNWISDTTAMIHPSEFSAPLEGNHIVKVTARNNTGLVNPEGETVNIELVKPTFEKKILIVDGTNEENWGINFDSTDTSVDEFYRSLFATNDPSQYDEWDYFENDGMPSREELGKYKLVVWHSDNKPTNAPHVVAEPANLGIVRDYLNVGGNLVIGGWRLLKSFAWRESLPKTFVDGSFVKDYLQIFSIDETPILAKFVEGGGVEDFATVTVDSTKLDFFPNNGAINNVNVITERGGFSELIQSYGTVRDSNYPQYRGQTVGVMYYGTSFNIGVLGYPLYFTFEEDAKQLADDLLREMEIER